MEALIMQKNKKVLLIICAILLSVLSPFILIAVCGGVFSLFSLFMGSDFTTSFSIYMNWIFSLSPYYPYLTAIPIIAIALLLILKARRHKKGETSEK